MKIWRKRPSRRSRERQAGGVACRRPSIRLRTPANPEGASHGTETQDRGRRAHRDHSGRAQERRHGTAEGVGSAGRGRQKRTTRSRPFRLSNNPSPKKKPRRRPLRKLANTGTDKVSKLSSRSCRATRWMMISRLSSASGRRRSRSRKNSRRPAGNKCSSIENPLQRRRKISRT